MFSKSFELGAILSLIQEGSVYPEAWIIIYALDCDSQKDVDCQKYNLELILLLVVHFTC
jgi:hypothetical protein